MKYPAPFLALTTLIFTILPCMSSFGATIEHVYLASPNILAVEINRGSKTPGQLLPYTKQDGDSIDSNTNARPPYHHLLRNGKKVGYIVGPQKDHVYLSPVFHQDPVDVSTLTQASHYTIASTTDSNHQHTLFKTLSHKAKPIDVVQSPNWKVGFITRHTIYLTLGNPLKQGHEYTLYTKFKADNGPFHFTYRDTTLESRALQVTYLGFHPNDPVKFGVLSQWNGSSGITYEVKTFSLLDKKTRNPVYTGEIKLTKSAEELDDTFNKWGQDRRVNIAKAPVYRLDFSAFNTPGEYVLHVPGLGCSHPFRIRDDVYQDTFAITMKGLFHQRSGIELKRPYTDYQRPMMFHPDANKTAVHSTFNSHPATYDPKTHANQKKVFGLLEKHATDKVENNIWGGHSDAGDFDRRVAHLIIPRMLFELVELFPDRLGKASTNIPESNNAIPDLIDEGLWGLDLFHRLKRKDGGVPSWIESSAHPVVGEPSWLDSLPLYVSAPSMRASYLYAATAARAARVLSPYDKGLSDQYTQGAKQAYAWAETKWKDVKDSPALMNASRDNRNLAALELYRLTEQASYHEAFKATTRFIKSGASLGAWQKPSQGGASYQGEAAFAYCQMPDDKTDAAIRQYAKQAILTAANMSHDFSKQTAHGWTKYSASSHIAYGTLGSPQAVEMVRAYLLTKDIKYLSASVRSSFFPYGMNADHLSFTTGIGRSPKHPLLHDQHIMNAPAPVGICLYGPWDPSKWEYWSVKFIRETKAMVPAYEQWPTSEGYLDIGHMIAGQAEFTVQQTMIKNTYVMGFLSGIHANATAP